MDVYVKGTSEGLSSEYWGTMVYYKLVLIDACKRLFLAICGLNGIMHHVLHSLAERVATLMMAAPAPHAVMYGSGC